MTDQSYQPTLSQLRAFVAVAEYRHFGTAAARLGVSQPTLSQALAALENGLGVQLIERSTRRVLRHRRRRSGCCAQAKAILEAADGFVAAAAGVGEPLAGPLRMGLIPTVAPYVLPALLPALRAELPGLRPQVVEDQTARLLEASARGRARRRGARAADRGAPAWSRSRSTRGFRARRAGGTTSWPAGPTCRRDVLDDLPLLLLDEGHCLRDQTLDLCRSVDAHPVGPATPAPPR